MSSLNQKNAPFAVRARAKADLCNILSALYNYPNRSNSEALVSERAWRECARMAEIARMPVADALERDGYMDDGVLVYPAEDDSADSDRALRLRVECTRLFWTYPSLVHLEGRHWVRPRGRGESVSVGACYREIGLRNKPGVTAPPDCLASELDFASYVLRAEADAWEGDDVASAREWHELYRTFLHDHLRSCAMGVARAVPRYTENDCLRFYGVFLAAFARER